MQPRYHFPIFHSTKFTSKPWLLACGIMESLIKGRKSQSGMVPVQSGKMDRKLPEGRKDWNKASDDAVSMATTLPPYSFYALFRAAISGSARNQTTAAHILFLTHLLIKIIIPYIEIALNGSGWRFWIAWGRSFHTALDAFWNDTCGYKSQHLLEIKQAHPKAIAIGSVSLSIQDMYHCTLWRAPRCGCIQSQSCLCHSLEAAGSWDLILSEVAGTRFKTRAHDLLSHSMFRS